MKKQLLGALLFFVIGVSAVLGPAAPPNDPVLFRIEKEEIARLSPGVLSAFSGLEELRGGWLIEASAGMVRSVLRSGVRLEVLDVHPAGKSYFLVFTPRAGDSVELAAYGGVKILDSETVLFLTDGREARELLPDRFALKRLTRNHHQPVTAIGPTSSEPDRRLGLLRPTAFDPSIKGLVDLVSVQSLAQTIRDLQGFRTRYANTPACEAAASYLAEAFSRLGFEVASDYFTFSTNSYLTRNIIATMPGKTRPDLVVLIGAHFDSTSKEAATNAPGADDNASGTAAVLEIARVLSGTSFDFTLKFVCFSAEEWGLYGSKHYAAEAKKRREKILAVLNLDMIAYTDRLPEDLDLVVNAPSEWLFNRYAICAALYTPLQLLKIVNPGMKYSDHAPFWDQGYAAVLGIEDVGVPNPYYHKTTDVFETLNLDFATSVTKLTVAVAAGLAQPIIR
jgi:hypothetical protein